MLERAIFSQIDLNYFLESKTYSDFMNFVKSCAESVNGISNSECKSDSPKIGILTSFFDDLIKLITEIPPVAQPMRFGNKAFRQWHQHVCEVL